MKQEALNSQMQGQGSNFLEYAPSYLPLLDRPTSQRPHNCPKEPHKMDDKHLKKKLVGVISNLIHNTVPSAGPWLSKAFLTSRTPVK